MTAVREFEDGEAAATGGEFIKFDVPLAEPVVIEATDTQYVRCSNPGCAAEVPVRAIGTGEIHICQACGRYT